MVKKILTYILPIVPEVAEEEHPSALEFQQTTLPIGLILLFRFTLPLRSVQLSKETAIMDDEIFYLQHLHGKQCNCCLFDASCSIYVIPVTSCSSLPCCSAPFIDVVKYDTERSSKVMRASEWRIRALCPLFQ